MTRDLIVGIDAGTSVIKAVAFDLDGRQLALTARPNRYDELPGGGVEQDHGPDLARHRRGAARAGRRGARAAAPHRRARGHRPGRRHLAGRREGAPVGAGWLWLDSRAAGIVSELEASGVRAAIYRYTGCGLNACNQSAQLVWLDRHAPGAAGAGRHRLPLQGLALSQPHRRARHRHLRGHLHLRRLPHPRAMRRRSSRPSDCRIWAHLLPPMIDGTPATHPLTPAAAAAIGLPAGTPVALGFVDVRLHRARRRPLRARPADRLLDRRLDRHAHAPRARRPTRSSWQTSRAATPCPSRRPAPAPGCSPTWRRRSTSTGSPTWRARRRGARAARRSSGERLSLALDARVLEARPGRGAVPSLYPRGRRARPLHRRRRPRPVHRALDQRSRFFDLVRAVYEGLAFAARDCYAAMGQAPGGDPHRRRRRPLPRLQDRSWRARSACRCARRRARRPGPPGAAMMAAVAIGAFPDMAPPAEPGSTRCWASGCCPIPAWRPSTTGSFPIYARTPQVMRPIWADLAAARRGDLA